MRVGLRGALAFFNSCNVFICKCGACLAIIVYSKMKHTLTYQNLLFCRVPINSVLKFTIRA